MIAYFRSVPPAASQLRIRRTSLTSLGVAMLGAGMLPSGKPVITSRVGPPPKGPTFQFGEYILSYQDCRECHGPRSSPKIGWNVGFGS